MTPFSGQASFCFDCEYSAQEVWGLGFGNFPVSSCGTICIEMQSMGTEGVKVAVTLVTPRRVISLEYKNKE